MNSEGIPPEDIEDIFESSLTLGDRGVEVRELQYLLYLIGLFNDAVPPITIDGVYGQSTRDVVESFQRAYGLDVTGSVTPGDWDVLFSVYNGILNVLPQGFLPPGVVLYPGYPLRLGSSGEYVEYLQEYLNYISDTYTEIPKLTVDGRFGAGTAEAVRTYQRQVGLTPNGVVGSVTWNSIVDTFVDLYSG